MYLFYIYIYSLDSPTVGAGGCGSLLKSLGGGVDSNGIDPELLAVNVGTSASSDIDIFYILPYL